MVDAEGGKPDEGGFEVEEADEEDAAGEPAGGEGEPHPVVTGAGHDDEADDDEDEADGGCIARACRRQGSGRKMILSSMPTPDCLSTPE